MFTSYSRHCFGSLYISHSCCLIIHVHLIHCICYKWTFMISSLGHHHIPCHHMCHATSSTMPSLAITTLVFQHHHIPCHHMCHATSSTMSFHAITTLVFHWVCHAIISTGYSFLIREHLLHQWQLYIQHCAHIIIFILQDIFILH